MYMFNMNRRYNRPIRRGRESPIVGMGHIGVVIECTSVCILLYYTKGRQVAGLGLVDIQPSVDGSRHVPAGHTA